MSIKLLLADDHQIVREGLRALVEKQPGLEVIGEAENGRSAVRLTKELLPDAVVMDVAMPDLNGIEATRQIVAEVPQVKVIALSVHADRRLVIQLIRAGASGYLLKDCTFEELTDAIRTVVEQNTVYLSPRIADVVVKEYLRKVPETEVSIFSMLSNREREVAQLVAEGKSTKEIASTLHVSVKTVETHRQQVIKKLNVRSTADLVKLAIREGLVFLET
ncbi:MAG: response regulator transcription factor [Pseudomonadota bacterium]